MGERNLMVDFAFKAQSKDGKLTEGVMSGPSDSVVRSRLTRQGLKVVSISKKKAGKAASSGGGDDSVTNFGPIKIVRDGKGGSQIVIGSSAPSTRDLVIFTKQFATMLSSGVPLIQTINVLSSQQKNVAFGGVLRKVQNDVENGKTLSEAMRMHKGVFDSLYIAMVRAGETSGSIDQILLRLTIYIEKAAKIKSQVKSAMVYPAIVVIAAIAVISALLAFVVPTFAKQFQDAGRELPALTQIVVDISDFFRVNILFVIGGAIGVIVGLNLYRKTEVGKAQFDRAILYVPVLGDLIRKVSVGRFCSTLSTMLKAGVNLLEALTICAASAGNKRVEVFILYVRAEIEQGVKFSTPLSKDGLFPPMVVSMVEVGEATGALDEMLQKVADFYEEEVDLAVKTLLSMIEPIMIVSIGSVVGFIVIAMYLPVFDMAGTVGG